MTDIRSSAHRRTPSPEASAAAFHEAGHAVAVVRAFRDAAWLPREAPAVPVRFIEVVESAGQWTGSCVGADIYSTGWSIDCIAKPYRALMEALVTIHLAGGVAEAIHRGERRAREVLRFARLHCSIDADLERARAVLDDLRRLTGCRYDAEDFVESTLALLLTHWHGVEALAQALIAHRRMAGTQVEEIIDSAS